MKMGYTLLQLFVLFLASSLASSLEYYGVYQGSLSQLAHGVKGEVYIASDTTFIVTNFHYDGSAPDAFFWVGKTTTPDENGVVAPHPQSPEVLGAYSGQNVIVNLPEGYKMSDVKYLSVWCRAFTADFGNLAIDSTKVPKPYQLGGIRTRVHDVSASAVIIMDTKTIKVKDFKYDGTAPDAYFLVGKGPVTSRGTKVPVKGEKLAPLPKYSGQDVILQLPGDLTVHDIAYLSVYCVAYSENFGEIVFPDPSTLTVPVYIPSDGDMASTDIENLPCKTILSKKMNVYWKKNGGDLQITLRGIVKEQEYLAFGVSGSPSSSAMVGGDVVVAYARGEDVVLGDYYLNLKSACTGVSGVCLDTSQNGKESMRKGNSQYNDGILTATYHRSFAADEPTDKPFSESGGTSVIAAIGQVDDRGEVKFHSTFFNKETIFIDFNDESSKCEKLTNDAPETKYDAWPPSKIFNETDLLVQLGPTGGQKGYNAITGSKSWGIAFFVNGFLIPEITVIRGVTYTFTIEAGNDKNANYHPLYITTDPQGGVGTSSDKEKTGIIAGVTKDKFGNYIPSAGRLCEFKAEPGKEEAWKTANTFAEFKKSLKLNCQAGQPAVFTWTPDETVPDLVYYQCWVHRNLGWKIHVTGSSSKSTWSLALLFSTLLFKILH